MTWQHLSSKSALDFSTIFFAELLASMGRLSVGDKAFLTLVLAGAIFWILSDQTEKRASLPHITSEDVRRMNVAVLASIGDVYAAEAAFLDKHEGEVIQHLAHWFLELLHQKVLHQNMWIPAQNLVVCDSVSMCPELVSVALRNSTVWKYLKMLEFHEPERFARFSKGLVELGIRMWRQPGLFFPSDVVQLPLTIPPPSLPVDAHYLTHPCPLGYLVDFACRKVAVP